MVILEEGNLPHPRCPLCDMLVPWRALNGTQKFLEGFHHCAARRITGMTTTCGAGGEWEYPPVVDSIESTGLHLIMEYIERLQATITKKVAC